MQDLIDSIRKFAEERDWEQFHSPKNLSMALTVEAGELMEYMQWLTEEESRNLPPDKLAQVEDEIGDVMIYLFRIADQLDINPLEAAQKKLVKNAGKYPVENAKGNALKYTEFK